MAKMYGIFNIALDSDIPLPELPEVKTGGDTLRIRMGSDAAHIPDRPDWSHHLKTPSGEVCASCAKLRGAWLLRFHDLADFMISFSGKTIEYFAISATQAETLRHLLIDQVIPRVLGQAGKLILHASAIALPDGKGIAFLGRSGWGKSTLASSFLGYGADLLTDDCLLIEEIDGQVYAIPNYYGVRLFEDSAGAVFNRQMEYTDVANYTSKKRLVLPEPALPGRCARQPLNALYLLDDPGPGEAERVAIEPTCGARELMALIASSFILEPTDQELIKKQFRQIGHILDTLENVYRLQYPRNYTFLNAVADRVLGSA